MSGCAAKAKISGNYEGILPCADYEGIGTVLSLNIDKSFKLEETHLGKNDNPFITYDKYIVDNSGKITLKHSSQRYIFKF